MIVKKSLLFHKKLRVTPMIVLFQIPRDVPHPQNNTPVDFSDPFQILLYGVVPIALIGFYFFLRKRSRGKEGISSDISEKDTEA